MEKKREEVILAEELNEIKKRCNGATPGPWIWFFQEQERPHEPFIKIVASQKSGNIDKLKPLFILDECDYGNAEFICMAKEDIQRLIRAVEKLQEFGTANAREERRG